MMSKMEMKSSVDRADRGRVEMKREKYEPVLKNISYFIKWVEARL